MYKLLNNNIKLNFMNIAMISTISYYRLHHQAHVTSDILFQDFLSNLIKK